jgi:hypothetical protein
MNCQSENRREPAEPEKKANISPEEDKSWQSLSQAEIVDIASTQLTENPKLAYQMAMFANKMNPKSAHGKAAAALAVSIRNKGPKITGKIRKLLHAYKTKYREVLTSLQTDNFRNWLLEAKPFCVVDEQKCLASIDKVLSEVEKVRLEIFGNIQVISCSLMGQYSGVQVTLDVSRLGSGSKRIDAIELFFFFTQSDDDPRIVVKRYGPFQGLNVKEDELLDETSQMPIPDEVNGQITLSFNSAPYGSETCGARVNYAHFTNGAEWRYR